MICRNTGAVLRHAMNLLHSSGEGALSFRSSIFRSSIPIIKSNDRNLLYGRGANDAPIDNRDELHEHASGCPAVRLMIRQDSGGIYHKFFFQSRFFYQMKHHAFSRRATADISKADKQYLFHNFSFNRFKNKSNDNFAECPERA